MFENEVIKNVFRSKTHEVGNLGHIIRKLVLYTSPSIMMA